MILSHTFTEVEVQQLISNAARIELPELGIGTWECAITWDGEDKTFTFTAKAKKRTLY